MGEGLTQVGLLMLLLLVVLPGAFFTLLALLDRLEHSLAAGSTLPTVAQAVGVPAAEIDVPDVVAADADVVALRLSAAVIPEPVAATG